MNTITLNTPLTISDFVIRQDADGRYCLNDLHKASGNEAKNKPSEWLRNKQAVELIAEIEKAGIPAIQSKQQVGTFAVKDMVYAYAMWISPAFTLKVIRAYDALVTKPQYGLKSLPTEPLRKTTKALPGCLSLETQDEIKQLIQDRAALQPKDKQAGFVISMWSALGTHFGIKKAKDDKIPAYKRIPEGARLECLSLIARLSADNLVTLTSEAFEEKINERIKALPSPEAKEGDLLPKPQPNSITLSLTPTGKPTRRLITQSAESELMVMRTLPDDTYIGTRGEVVNDLKADNFVVAERTAHGVRDMVMNYLPIQVMPVILEAATTRLERCGWKIPEISV